jgi:hypothetical protein
MTSLETLRASLHALLDANPDGALLVTLEAFFTGNDDLGSIGCNLTDHPGMPAFRDTLLNVRSQDEVEDVVVRISDLNGDDEWPFSDTVYVVTSASPETVGSWVNDLEPDAVWALDEAEMRACGVQPPPGAQVVAVWWD